MEFDRQRFKELVEEYMDVEVGGDVQEVIVVDEVRIGHEPDGVAIVIGDYGPNDYWWVIGGGTPLCCYDYKDYPLINQAKHQHYGDLFTSEE